MREKTSHSFRLQRAFYLLLFYALSVSIAHAQSGTIKGVVTDEFGEEVIGANVVEKGTTNGTVTDLDGNFTLTVSNMERAVLQISYIGYSTIEETVNGRTSINVQLESSVINLGEVVAIGYGTQTRREITGSVANISEENFNKGVTRDAADLLQGKVAGLLITSGSGDITRETTIRLRGTSTLQKDMGPLIVIDGIPGGDLSTVSPNDIEAVSVLKDASSAAIYGSRAAGGVILVTTKRGSGSRTQVNYDGYIGIERMANKPDLLNADQWRAYAKYAEFPQEDINTYDQYGADTDWFDELTRTGVSQNHALSLSGGGPKNNYRASFSYLNRNGIMRDNSMERYNFRFQFQQRAINDRLRIGLTGSATMNEMYIPNGDNFVLAYSMLPVYPVYNADGSYFTKVNAEYDQGNPVQNQDLNEQKREVLNFYGVGDIQFTIMDGLNVKANLYKSRTSNEYSRYDNSETSIGRTNNGYADKRNRIQNRQVMEWTADYENSFGREGDHKVQGMIGYSWEESTRSDFRAQNRSFLLNDLGYNSLESGMGLQKGDVTSSKESFKLISMFARGHYSYKERYMVTATIRRDGSSKFGANHKWGTFPSASAAWGISQEDFMQDATWVNDLKLRAGYGVTGNQDGLQPYKSLQLYGTGEGIYYEDGSWLTIYNINQNANPDLKWEQTSMLNVGVDFTLFNRRLSGTIEWYDKRTKDMLYEYDVPTPPFSHNRMMANVGDMKNTGIEIMLNMDIIRNKDFSWNMSVNMDHNKNEVTRLSNDLYTTNEVFVGNPWIRGGSQLTSHVVKEGYPIGQFYMYKCLGIVDGKYVFEDQNDDGQITEDDRTFAGSAQPKLNLGWNNSFTWKEWDLSFFFRGSFGQKVLNNPRAAYANNTYLIGTNALNDPLLYELKGQSSVISDFYLENASYMRLDNLSLGYTFNTKNINWLDRARIYVAGQNLFVITGYKGTDPEVELFTGNMETDRDQGLSPGIENRQFYPKARTFTFGVSLTF